MIGQRDAFSTSCVVSQIGLCGPAAVAVDSRGEIFTVMDGQNNRVLECAAPLNSGIVAGQPASKVFAQGGDSSDARAATATAPAADVALAEAVPSQHLVKHRRIQPLPLRVYVFRVPLHSTAKTIFTFQMGK